MQNYSPVMLTIMGITYLRAYGIIHIFISINVMVPRSRPIANGTRKSNVIFSERTLVVKELLIQVQVMKTMHKSNPSTTARKRGNKEREV